MEKSVVDKTISIDGVDTERKKRLHEEGEVFSYR